MNKPPIIISASRSTDIPAFHSEWFMNRLRAGYVKWINPFNQQKMTVSFKNARLIVFWTKNPKPIIKHLKEIDQKNINYYFTYTLNDYEREGFEPNIPSFKDRIETFKELSKMIGKDKVIWRFDPIIKTNKMPIESILKKIKRVGDKIHKYTEKLVISFADINIYNKVQSNLAKRGIISSELTVAEIEKLAKGIQELNKDWGLVIATCAEKSDLKKYGIEHNKCVDDELMIRLFKGDKALMDYLGYEEDLFSTKVVRKYLKDKGQRKECGCIISKDIGQYNTCGHLCVYCYANHSEALVKNNLRKRNPNSETIVE